MSDSWWLKFKRAQQHMVDIEGYATAYADSHPYKAVRIKYGKRQQGIWRYRLSFTEDPDPWIAIILGDFVHNLRSALDHVVVGAVTKRYQSSAGFPIEEGDPWRKKGRRFVERDPEVRKRFLRRIKGLSSEAQAFVKTCQPYQRPDRSHENILFILSSLENLDKHRKLIATASGLINPTRTITIDGQTETQPLPLTQRQFLRNGAVFDLKHPTLATKRDAEVDVQYRGTAAVHVEIAQGGKGHITEYPLDKTLDAWLTEVEFILKTLE